MTARVMMMMEQPRDGRPASASAGGAVEFKWRARLAPPATLLARLRRRRVKAPPNGAAIDLGAGKLCETSLPASRGAR